MEITDPAGIKFSGIKLMLAPESNKQGKNFFVEPINILAMGRSAGKRLPTMKLTLLKPPSVSFLWCNI